MSLESGTYISDLVETNPQGTDPKSQGDDHLRLIKDVLKNSLPTLNGPLSAVLVPVTPVGNIAATNVQAAIAELDSDKAPWTAITGPAFIASINNQAIGAVATILTATEVVDTNNCFAGNKFTPDVAGLYQVNLSLVNNIADNWCGAYIYKNGVSVALQIIPGLPSALGSGARPSITALVQMNGTTDYIQAAGYNSIAGFSINQGHFSGSLARAS